MEYIFYEIKCNDETITDFYIGSTSNFTRRKCCHKTCCNNETCKNYNLKIYTAIRANGGWNNWTMLPIDKQNFETKLDARIYENKLITERQATLNTKKAFATIEDRKEFFNEYHQTDTFKNYQKAYKKGEKYKEYQREWQKANYAKKKLEKLNNKIDLEELS